MHSLEIQLPLQFTEVTGSLQFLMTPDANDHFPDLDDSTVFLQKTGLPTGGADCRPLPGPLLTGCQLVHVQNAKGDMVISNSLDKAAQSLLGWSWLPFNFFS